MRQGGLTLVLLGCLALGACGEESARPQEPTTPPSPTSSVTPSSTSSATPELPEAAKAGTKAGAVAFVRYYIELINHAQATGNTAALKAVEAPSCGSCLKGRRYIEDIYSSGGHIEGGAFRIIQVLATPMTTPSSWLVTTGIRISADIVVKPGETPSSVAHNASKLVTSVSTSFVDGEWIVAQRTRGS